MSEDKFPMDLDVLTADISTTEKEKIWLKIENEIDEIHSTEEITSYRKNRLLRLKESAYVLAGIVAAFFLITVALHPKTKTGSNSTMGSGLTSNTNFLANNYLYIAGGVLLLLILLWFFRRRKFQTSLKRRWLRYILVGVLFGVFDYYLLYFQPQGILHSPGVWNKIVGLTLSYGIWLLPSVPVVLHEAKVSHSRLMSGLANSLTWLIAVVVYNVENVVHALIDTSNMYMSIYYFKTPGSGWIHLLTTDILRHVVIALVGGLIVGVLISLGYFFVRRKPE